MRRRSDAGENVTDCKPSALLVASLSATGYSMGIGGKELPPPLASHDHLYP